MPEQEEAAVDPGALSDDEQQKLSGVLSQVADLAKVQEPRRRMFTELVRMALQDLRRAEARNQANGGGRLYAAAVCAPLAELDSRVRAVADMLEQLKHASETGEGGVALEAASAHLQACLVVPGKSDSDLASVISQLARIQSAVTKAAQIVEQQFPPQGRPGGILNNANLEHFIAQFAAAVNGAGGLLTRSGSRGKWGGSLLQAFDILTPFFPQSVTRHVDVSDGWKDPSRARALDEAWRRYKDLGKI